MFATNEAQMEQAKQKLSALRQKYHAHPLGEYGWSLADRIDYWSTLISTPPYAGTELAGIYTQQRSFYQWLGQQAGETAEVAIALHAVARGQYPSRMLAYFVDIGAVATDIEQAAVRMGYPELAQAVTEHDPRLEQTIVDFETYTLKRLAFAGFSD